MLIEIDGADGSGKTTLIRELRNFAVSHRIENWVFTHEPFDRELTKWIFSQRNNSPIAALFAFSLDRVMHLRHLANHLRDSVVFCDRYFLSTLVYQCQTVEAEEMAKHLFVESGCVVPDLTVLTVAEPVVLAKRCGSRGTAREVDTYEPSPDKVDQFAQLQERYIIASGQRHIVPAERIIVVNTTFRSLSSEVEMVLEALRKMHSPLLAGV